MSLRGAITDLCALDDSVSRCFILPFPSAPLLLGSAPLLAHRAIRLSRTRAHSEWIKSRKKERGREGGEQPQRVSVLADSSDLGIYGEEDLGSDIDPGCFMCTAHGPLKATEIPCAQLGRDAVGNRGGQVGGEGEKRSSAVLASFTV